MGETRSRRAGRLRARWEVCACIWMLSWRTERLPAEMALENEDRTAVVSSSAACAR